MPPTPHQRIVLGYHGTDAKSAAAMAPGPVRPSDNAWDWLGRGFYVWEYGKERAGEWASGHHPDPAIVEATIDLGNCFDLTDVRIPRILERFAPRFVASLDAGGSAVPQNRPPRHDFDRALINWTIGELEAEGAPPFDTVRGAFVEGHRIYDVGAIRSEIHTETHVQIAVRNLAAILSLRVV